MSKAPHALRFLLPIALAAGCGTGGYHVPYQGAHGGGHSANPNPGDVAFLAADVAVGALLGGQPTPETAREPSRWASSSPDRPAPPHPRPAPPLVSRTRLFGKVTGESGARVPFVRVTLQGPADFIALETRTDINGRFWFPWPLPAGWYRLTAENETDAGQTEVWLKDRPAILNVVARARETPPSD